MNRIDLSTMYSVSDLLVRSPSCSCVLDDLLQLLAEQLGFNTGLLYILDGLGQPALIARHGLDEMIIFAEKVIELLPTISIEKNPLQRNYQWMENRLIPKETGEHLLVYLPLWLENKISGSLCLIGRGTPPLNSGEMKLLQVIANQISQAMEKELVEGSLSKMQNFFNSVLGSITEGIVIFNRKKVLYFNQMAKTLLKIEEVDGEISLECFNQWVIRLCKDKLKSQVYLETALNLKLPEYFFEIETVRGKFLRFSLFLITDDWQGELGWGFLISDITQKKEAEQLRDDMLAMTSHELRTPLTSIKGNVSALLRKDVSWSMDEQQLFLQDIYEECNRLDELIANQLDIAKIKAGALKLDLCIVTVADLLNKTKQQLDKRYSKPCVIRYFVAEQEAVLNIDEQRIIQVLLNLVDNAVKHGPTGIVVEIIVQKRERQLVFAVKDNGYGILPEHLNRIFDKFYHIQDKHNHLNNGLGLAICKGLVEAHHGQIWAESVVGEGSCFYFSLPMKLC